MVSVMLVDLVSIRVVDSVVVTLLEFLHVLQAQQLQVQVGVGEGAGAVVGT